MRSLLRFSAAALMGLGFIALAPVQAEAQGYKPQYIYQPETYRYVPPPAPVYYPPRYYAPPVYVPPPVYYAPRPRYYGGYHGGYRHGHGRRW
ncbi:hypothetical protein [Rhodovarius sp.]|uniref:hypothetical protein n=1 Tax=Rhodovarius sp. TaxID=2972673 RepID=UPI003340710D